MPESSAKSSSASKWLHPNQVLQLHRLKAKKKALQARIQSCTAPSTSDESAQDASILGKRTNPFVIQETSKKKKTDEYLEDTSDQTLFKLLRLSEESTKPIVTNFNNVLQKINESKTESVQVVKAKGESWIPIDWALKTRIRFLSASPFNWNQKLKISEEASGVTGFARCLTSSLDTSPNAQFHQCCLFWQQPFLPWINLFPRTNTKSSISGIPSNLLTAPAIKDSLQSAWADSFRSVFQLIRTKQCPYFYVCANTFTVLFRAGGISGFSEMHAIITPTTRGLRQLLRQEEIEFKMPLKSKRLSDHGYETADSVLCESEQTNDALDDEEEEPDDEWMQSMGINAEDIRKINLTQTKIANKIESKVDNSEESLVLIEGMELHALYNFLINYKSAVAITGRFAGIPPTILAPVAFHGATLNSLKVRESKVHVDDADYHSLDLIGPILPSTIHNLCLIHPPEGSFTATFSNVPSTIPLSKITKIKTETGTQEVTSSGSAVFGKENLSDCGLNAFILKKFCSDDSHFICNTECLKYTGDTKTFTWT